MPKSHQKENARISTLGKCKDPKGQKASDQPRRFGREIQNRPMTATESTYSTAAGALSVNSEYVHHGLLKEPFELFTPSEM